MTIVNTRRTTLFFFFDDYNFNDNDVNISEGVFYLATPSHPIEIYL